MLLHSNVRVDRPTLVLQRSLISDRVTLTDSQNHLALYRANDELHPALPSAVLPLTRL